MIFYSLMENIWKESKCTQRNKGKQISLTYKHSKVPDATEWQRWQGNGLEVNKESLLGGGAKMAEE